MAIYQYQKTPRAKGCPHCRSAFEVFQPMSADPIAKCARCGGPVRRIISLCSVSGTPSDKARLSDSNLKRHGFTKLVNEGEGKFRKTV